MKSKGQITKNAKALYQIGIVWFWGVGFRKAAMQLGMRRASAAHSSTFQIFPKVENLSGFEMEEGV